MTHDIAREQIEEAERDRMSRELSLARDQAELANRAKSRFLASVTHELRTPLHGMLGYAELMSLEGGLNTIQTERLEAMMASGQHLLDMINATLDMSRIEADELELLPSDIDLPDLIRTCLNVVRPAAEAKGLDLAPAPSEPLRLFADPTRVRQVLINLLDNAVKFTPSGSVEVQTRLTGDGARIRLEVVDTGPGIWLRHRDKLFHVFERLNANVVSGVEGTGLGLAIAARLVQLMEGQIGYLDNPRGGSVFWLELPVHEHLLVAKDEAETVFALDERPRLRVLVADDEPLNRSIASGFLSKAGHEVVCVSNGEAAIEAATAEDFDVILMDVRMPGMNGMEATRVIRRLPPPRGQIRIVALTAQAFAQQIEMCRSAGMDSHISKPFKRAVLLAAVEDRVVASNTVPLTNAVDPVFDRVIFDEVTDLLLGTEVEESLRLLMTRCEAILHALSETAWAPRRAGGLIADAHRLAGSAGTFGFMLVAAVARQFEVAGDTVTFADHLAQAIETSMPSIRQELAVAAQAIH